MRPSLSPYNLGFNAGVGACVDIGRRVVEDLEAGLDDCSGRHHRRLMIQAMQALVNGLAALYTDGRGPDGAPVDPDPPTSPAAPAAAAAAA